ncbi:MAG: hypothetical protein J6K23_05500 [Bacilli bacterium]|nr:hypothetical protein [Bacilli bacterium]
MTNKTLLIIFSLIYMFGLIFLYFSKSRLNNKENKVYKIMLIVNVIGLILQLLCDYVSFKYDVVSKIFSSFVFKAYLVYFIVFVNLMLLYLIILVFKKYEKLLIKCDIVITFVESWIVCVAPYSLYRNIETRTFYTYGLAINLSFIFSTIVCMFMFIVLIVNWNKMSKTKSIPIYLLIFSGLISAAIQHTYPDIIIITSMESCICFLMYFTIENPDLQLLEEVTKIKEITEKTNEDKSSFLYHVTDEMNIVLNSVKTKLDNINKMEDVNEIKSSLREISAIVNNSKKRVNASINISEMDLKELKVMNSSYNIVNLLNSIIAYNRNKINNKVDFRCNISNTLPEMLYGDSIKIKQIINSVIDNSIKNTNTGFIELRVSCILKYDICRLIIAIEDSGTGIDLVKQNKILSDNSDLDINEIKVKDDLIVNLKTVNKLINMIGGTLSIESLNNNGTTINITLDQKIVQRGGTNLDETIDSYNKYMKNKKIIGIISESKNCIKVIKSIGKKNGDVIEYFDMTKTCLDKIRNGESFNIIVIDEDMDKIDARSFLDKVRQVDGFKGKVFVITKNKSINLKKELKEYGFDAVLINPLNKKDIEDNFK